MRVWRLLLLALSGCVAQRMASSVGHPVTEVTRRFGPPTQVQYITANSALYVWTMNQDLRPGPKPLGTFQPINDFRQAQRRYKRKDSCEFHVLVRRRDAESAWLVHQVQDPGLGCS